MNKKNKANNSQKTNSFDSPQWLSESTIPNNFTSVVPRGNPSGSGSPDPIVVSISLDKHVASCPSGATCSPSCDCRYFIATGTATKNDVPIDLTVSGPDGSSVSGNGVAVLEYEIKMSECGSEGIIFVAQAESRTAEVKADVVDVKFNMGDPHRVGITANGHDRTQHLSLTVSPAKYTKDVALTADATKLSLTNLVKNETTGVITFDLVGTVKSATKGDAWLKADVTSVTGGTFTRKVSVVVPNKIAIPHQGGVHIIGGQKLYKFDANTSPAEAQVPAGKAMVVMGAYFFMTIVVTDQFDEKVGALYLGSDITEGGTKINQKLNADSNYSDPVGVGQPIPDINNGNGMFWNWNDPNLQQALKPENNPFVPFENSPWIFKNEAVEVDGFPLNPGIVNRKIRFLAPDKIEINWP